MTTTDPNAFLMGGGVKSASFPTIGTTVSGRIVRDPEVKQQIDPDDDMPKTFANGDPMMQLIVQLATDERDPDVNDDDGVRGLYVKSNMLNAVRAAVRTSGAKGLAVGGVLSVTFSAEGEQKKKAWSAPKLYTATYQPPAVQAAADFLMGGNGQAQTAAAPVAPTAQPAPVGNPPPGIDPNLWAQMTTDQRASVLAVTANVG